MFRDALVSGTSNWDVVIYRTCSLLIVSCDGSRVGDVGRSHNYKGQEYLRFEHVKIKLFEDDRVESISMFIDYVYDKGHK